MQVSSTAPVLALMLSLAVGPDFRRRRHRRRRAHHDLRLRRVPLAAGVTIKSIGFALAVGVLVDGFRVRLTIAAAAMSCSAEHPGDYPDDSTEHCDRNIRAAASGRDRGHRTGRVGRRQQALASRDAGYLAAVHVAACDRRYRRLTPESDPEVSAEVTGDLELLGCTYQPGVAGRVNPLRVGRVSVSASGGFRPRQPAGGHRRTDPSLPSPLVESISRLAVVSNQHVPA